VFEQESLLSACQHAFLSPRLSDENKRGPRGTAVSYRLLWVYVETGLFEADSASPGSGFVRCQSVIHLVRRPICIERNSLGKLPKNTSIGARFRSLSRPRRAGEKL